MDDDDDLIGLLAGLVAAVLAGDLVVARSRARRIAAQLPPGAELRAAVFDPVGLAEIAAWTGESKQNLNYLMGSASAPEPVRLARMKVWRQSEVGDWWSSMGREIAS
jgi:predicted DNA-binding transcriptional regulator AlpA